MTGSTGGTGALHWASIDVTYMPEQWYVASTINRIGFMRTGRMTCLYLPFAINQSHGDNPMTKKTTPIACPKCQSRAIRGSDGNDITFSFTDHDAPAKEDAHGEKNGTEARLRICVNCSNVWATLKREVEA